jgi:hypothetical protein
MSAASISFGETEGIEPETVEYITGKPIKKAITKLTFCEENKTSTKIIKLATGTALITDEKGSNTVLTILNLIAKRQSATENTVAKKKPPKILKVLVKILCQNSAVIRFL